MKVLLSDAVFYDVSEIHIENDPEGGHNVYLTLMNKSDGDSPLRHYRASRITCFAPGDATGAPRVIVDGKEIAPNPQAPPADEDADARTHPDVARVLNEDPKALSHAEYTSRPGADFD